MVVAFSLSWPGWISNSSRFGGRKEMLKLWSGLSYPSAESYSRIVCWGTHEANLVPQQ
jgi:hypothetical protein